ncbi:hypothetical protein CA51_43820 [Rosistilla oblonga]|nr:hypothetical protein CA51_43820 [Rosistilla oblonga]
MWCQESDEPVVVNKSRPVKAGNSLEDKTVATTCKASAVTEKRVTPDRDESKGHHWMRRGEVLFVIGENTENEQSAADTIREDRRSRGTVHSGDAGNC